MLSFRNPNDEDLSEVAIPSQTNLTTARPQTTLGYKITGDTTVNSCGI